MKCNVQQLHLMMLHERTRHVFSQELKANIVFSQFSERFCVQCMEGSIITAIK